VYRRNAVPGRVRLAHSALPDDVLGCYGTVDERRLYGYAVGLRHSARARAAGPGARRVSVCNCIVHLTGTRAVYAIGGRFIVSNFLSTVYSIHSVKCVYS
jgi:hypothetical protein